MGDFDDFLNVRVMDVEKTKPKRMKKRRVGKKIETVQWRAPRKAGRLTNLEGAAYRGMKFERAWADYMKNRYDGFLHGKWLYWIDENGWGYCQPDGLLRLDDTIYVFECKLNFWKQKAFTEINTLYVPLLKWLAKQQKDKVKFKGVQVCRHLKPSASEAEVVFSMREVIECQKKQVTWRWAPSIS